MDKIERGFVALHTNGASTYFTIEVPVLWNKNEYSEWSKAKEYAKKYRNLVDVVAEHEFQSYKFDGKKWYRNFYALFKNGTMKKVRYEGFEPTTYIASHVLEGLEGIAFYATDHPNHQTIWNPVYNYWVATNSIVESKEIGILSIGANFYKIENQEKKIGTVIDLSNELIYTVLWSDGLTTKEEI